MQQSTAEDIVIHMPIMELGFSHSFKIRAAYMRVETIREILDVPRAELEGRRGFNDDWMEELLDFAEQRGFAQLIRSK